MFAEGFAGRVLPFEARAAARYPEIVKAWHPFSGDSSARVAVFEQMFFRLIENGRTNSSPIFAADRQVLIPLLAHRCHNEVTCLTERIKNVREQKGRSPNVDDSRWLEPDPVVEGAEQGSMARLDCCIAWLDTRRL